MSLIDDFENAFQACLAPFTNPTSSHVFDNDELKANADNISRFLDISRQIESFFIQKRAILADQRPELILTEEINELKVEINRKEALLNKYHDKLSRWTQTVNDACNGKPPTTNPPAAPMPGQPGPVNPQQQPMMPIRMGQPGMQTTNMAAMNQMKMQMGPQNSPMVGSPMNPQMPPMPQFNPSMAQNQANQNVGGLQGPLAYLERTTCNIGIPDNRR